MLKFVLPVAMLLTSAAASASKYMCVTSPSDPQHFYYFDDDKSFATLYRMKDPNKKASDYVHKFRFYSLEKEIVEVKHYASSEISGGDYLWIKPDTTDLLYIPFLQPGLGVAKLEMDEMSFNGKEVKKLTYSVCHDD